MKKKYYYDCPIQALYMMKEFGVEFFIKDDDGERKRYEKTLIKLFFIEFLLLFRATTAVVQTAKNVNPLR